MKPIIISSIFLCSTLLTADNLAITSAPKEVALTLYGNNLAMITEKRSVEIEKTGQVKLMYPGVPSSIDTSSILASFSKPVRLYSQNYSYDVISYDSLLKYHLGKTIHYIEKEDSVEIKEGTLLATNPLLVRERNFGVIFKPYQIFFPDIPREMAVKPSLFWNIETQAETLDIGLKYLARGMSWKSDYTVNLSSDTHLNLNSWITITNNSGATYQDANITVLAGEVNAPRPQSRRVYAKRAMLQAAKDEANIQSESFSGYHIYPIPFRETIKNKEKKQISFIEKKKISYQKYALNKEQIYFTNFGERKLRFDQIIDFKNSRKNHLGIPLPKGTVRVYKEDKSGTSRFVGAANISDIPKDEKVKLTIGKYFDITGKERVTSYRQTSKERHIGYEIILSNHGKENEVVKIQKSIPVNQGKLTVTDSCSKQCSKEELNAFNALYTIPLKPDESYTLTIDYDLKIY